MSASSAPLPEPVDLTHHLSRTTKNRVQSNVKAFYKYFMIPGIGQLAGGLPNPGYFPYDTLEAQVALPDRWDAKPPKPVDPPTKPSGVHTSTRELVPKDSPMPNPLQKIDLSTALQYGQAQGYPALYYFIRQFTRNHLHPSVPYKGGPEVILTCGSTDGFAKTIECFNNPWSEGDPIEAKEGLLCEEYAYMNAIGTARPRGMNIVPVRVDDEGMTAHGPRGLEDVLTNWDFSKGKRPHMIYTVT
jgi:DNA-binding transcriptional MocR family regulator